MIDIHTHLHPPRLFKAIRRWFEEHSNWKLTHPTEPEAVADSLRKHGVERFVFCSYAHKPGMADELNQWLGETSRQLNRYGLPLATVHPEDNDRDHYYQNALRNGCIGLKIHEDVQRIKIDDPRLDRILQLTAENRGFILVHVGKIPFSQDTDNGPLRIKSVLQRHPALKIVVAHLGIPDTLDYLELTKTFPNLNLDTTMALTHWQLHAEITAQQLAPHTANILFGSDHPNLPYPYEDEVNAVKSLALPAEDEHKIFSKNATSLLASHLGF